MLAPQAIEWSKHDKLPFVFSVFQEYDRSVDWWCLGTVLYEMLFGLPPFYSRDTTEMYDKILNKPLTMKTTISESARDVLNKVSAF